MANSMSAFQIAERLGSFVPTPTAHGDRGASGTAFDIALTLGTLGVGGMAMSGTRTAAHAGTALKWFGYARRPVLSYGVHQGYRGASTLMGVSKAYAIIMLAHGIYEMDKNIALARDKEYKRLGINLMGPPGSLWLYDKIYDGPSEQSLASSSTPSQQNGGANGTTKTSTGSQKSKPKYLYKKRGQPCPPGYRASGGQCVLIGRR
jgi:hypothetical protein